MYYSDLIAIGKTEVSSKNFCFLVDAAVMLYEEEHRQGKSKCQMKILSKKEEESDMRFFHVFPRKKRSKFVIRRRNPQQIHQNLNLAFTSSQLHDLNSIPVDSETEEPRNPHQWLSSSSILGDENKPEMEKENPPNPNSQSSPSSCLTEKTSRKRHAVQEREPCGKAKKAKVSPLSWKGRETPKRLVDLMEVMIGSELKLIFEKTLFETDVKPSQSRLSMPFNSLIRNDFLNPVESRIIEEDINNNDKTGIGAILVDQRNVKWGVMLKRWETKGGWNYTLVCGWNDIVKANRLKSGDNISVWSFRWCGILCFSLVPPPPAMAQTSSLCL